MILCSYCFKRALNSDFHRQRNTIAAVASLTSTSGILNKGGDGSAFSTHCVLPLEFLAARQVDHPSQMFTEYEVLAHTFGPF